MSQSDDLKNQYKDWALFKRILVHLKPYSALVSFAILLLLAVSILNLAGPYLTKIVIDDHIVEQAIECIEQAAKTDRIGDGKIFVSNIEQVIRIRTGEKDSDAV